MESNANKKQMNYYNKNNNNLDKQDEDNINGGNRKYNEKRPYQQQTKLE